jgi:adenosylcobinamide-GDP ribazoletransferase
LLDIVDALGLLTRMPVSLSRPPSPRAVWAYPVVGLFVGAVGGAVDHVCLSLGCPGAVAAIWAVAAQVLLTGALHEDGLADTADGFGGGNDKARKLAIMRDSRIGVFGAMALFLVLGIRVGSIADKSAWSATCAMMAAGASGRAGLVVLLVFLQPARSDGVAAKLHHPPYLAMATGLIVAVMADLVGGLQTVASGAIACFTVAWAAQRQIGGYTGDVLGASEQLIEAAVVSIFTRN